MKQNCQLISSPAQMQSLSAKWQLEKQTIGFVATMGCLHNGHMSLIQEAKKRSQKTVVSIFVNPMQFGKNEDLTTYPRPFDKDIELCQKAGVDVIFCPLSSDVYPSTFSTTLSGGRFAKEYCGRTRPVFFNGILTVVQILFHLVKPTLSFFGEKDFQQLFLIKKMCKDLWIPTEIVPMPIIREENGLAMSSRNTYLSIEQKAHATCLHQASKRVQKAVLQGHNSTSKLLSLARTLINQTPSMSIDYISLVSPKTLEPLGNLVEKPARLLMAAYIGHDPKVRLIDNTLISVKQDGV